jgi:hypothetical protein
MNLHLSEDQISDWIAGQRGEEADRHLRECAECAAEVQRTQKALLLFRDSGFQRAKYWQQQPGTGPAHRFGRWVAVAAAMVVTVVAVVILHHRPTPESQPRQEVFLKIPYVVPPAPYERTAVIRMNVPVAALIAAGFTMNTPASDSVSADVLVGQDGRPLAVGFPENIQ